MPDQPTARVRPALTFKFNLAIRWMSPRARFAQLPEGVGKSRPPVGAPIADVSLTSGAGGASSPPANRRGHLGGTDAMGCRPGRLESMLASTVDLRSRVWSGTLAGRSNALPGPTEQHRLGRSHRPERRHRSTVVLGGVDEQKLCFFFKTHS